MAGGFRSGDHLKVRRPRGYDHHAIYISDDRVTQFGSGITLTDKSRTAARSPSPSSYRAAPRQSNAMATRACWTPATTRPALSRVGRSLPRWAIPAIIVWVVGGYAAIATYNEPDTRYRRPPVTRGRA
jgi:hypothetical protein